tara:strand:+ start:1922 stop:2161 length:240 start_codon:yes stop_codon:yes gene_type:complete
MSDYKYAIYHAGVKEWWTLDDNSFIVRLSNLPEWDEDETDLQGYSWDELEPHAVPVLDCVNHLTCYCFYKLRHFDPEGE